MTPQVVTKRQMSINFRRANCESMNLMCAHTLRRGLPEITAGLNAKLTHSLVSQMFKPRSRIKRDNIGYHSQHVNDWLRNDSWDGRGPNVMQFDESRTKRRPHCGGLSSKVITPTRVMLHEDDWASRPIFRLNRVLIGH